MMLTTAIFAGGNSRRMGRDKANLLIEGQPLLERTVTVAQAADLPVLVVGRLRPLNWTLEAVGFVEDALPERGPLGGLHTALTRANGPVLALACDLPRLTADALSWLKAKSQLERGGEMGLIVVNAGRWEPLFSVYSPACLPLIEARMREGRLSLHGLIEAGSFGMAEAPTWIEPLLFNVNTPEELRGIS